MIKNTAFILAFVGFTTISLAGCKTNEAKVKDLSTLPDSPDISYTAMNLIGHSIERLVHDQGEVAEVRIFRPKVYGLDENSALVYGNFHAIAGRRYQHLPQAYGFIFKTTNGGRTWMQVLDHIEHRVSDLSIMRFVDEKHGWLIWEWNIEGSSFGMLRTQNAGYTWQESRIHGIGGGNPVLGDWAFSSPRSGVAVVWSIGSIPVGDDLERELAYWNMATEDGGRNWEVTETVATDERRRYTEEAIPKNWWIDSSPRWRIRKFRDSFSVQRLRKNSKWEDVLSLPMTPYRNNALAR